VQIELALDRDADGGLRHSWRDSAP
jgi:hypothetical protein